MDQLAIKTDQANDVTVESSKAAPQMSPQHVTVIEVGNRAPASEVDGKRTTEKPFDPVVMPLDSEKELELALVIENLEREKIIQQLNEAIEKERKSVEHLQELLAETTQ